MKVKQLGKCCLMNPDIVKDTCSKCRSCCHSVRIPFKKESVSGLLIKKKFEDDGWDNDQLLYEDPGHPEFWVYDTSGKRCLFLDVVNYVCKIQHIKPVVCKMFPLKWDNKFMYYVDLCPLSLAVPIKDIYGWREGHELEIKDVTYYVNPKESDQLLPISYILQAHQNFKKVLFNENK